MQVIKSISILSAVLASVAVAAPLPVAKASGSPQQIVQEAPDGHLFVPAGNNAPAPTPAATPAPVQAPAVTTVQAVTTAAVTTAAAPAHTGHGGHKSSAASAAAPSNTAAPTQAQTKASTPTQSKASTPSQSQASTSSGATGGSGLTIINKCSKTVSAAKFANLAQNNNGAPQDIQPGGSAHFAIDGGSQVVKVYWQGTDIWSGDNTNSEVEWNVNNGMAFYDLSLLKGNPFLQYGQRLDGPCASTLTGSKSLSCPANDASCAGTYFPGYTQDAGISCPALQQGQGLTYTLCSS